MSRRVARTPVLPTGLPKLDPSLGPLNRTLYQSLIDHSNRINGGLQADGSERATAPVPLAMVATADLPDPAEWEGATLYVTDGGPGDTPMMMFSNGVNWIQAGGGGGGDMLSANNLTDVDNAAASFDNIKQPSTTSYAGVIRIATEAEIRAPADAIAVPAMGTILDSYGWVQRAFQATTQPWDWADGPMQYIALAGNTALQAPSNPVPGTFRTLHIYATSGTLRTLTFATTNAFGGLRPSLPDISNVKHYVLTVLCMTTTHFLVTAIDGSPP